MRGQALEQHRGGVLESDAVGQRHGAVRGRERVARVAAGGKDEGDAVAGLHAGDAGTHGLDDTGAFEAERQRKLALVKAAAELRVEQIDARRLDRNQHLAGSRRRHRHGLKLHHLGAAVRVHADRCHACRLRHVRSGCTR
jgi:hypothetical protein